MRQQLKILDEQRGLFRGTFKKYGLKSGYKGASTETILLVSVRDGNGKIISDHCWFNMTKGFAALGTLKEGNIIQFEARVKKYRKGYINRRAGIDQSSFDYKLSHPTKITLVR
ncbi:MAG TPA: hypothetical protein VHD83_12760 [Puia sp.]|nr:hypothetical protein [Puia sp.]